MCNSAAVCAIWIACLFLLHTDLSLALGNDIHLPHIDVESDANLPRVDVSYDPDDIRDTILTLQPDVVMVFRAVNVPKWTQFAVFQAHSQAHPLILSHNPTLSPGNHVNGTNIGLISRFAKDAINQEKQVYLINPHPFNVTIMVFIIFYDKRAPVPGGCNMEFDVETAPWLRVSYDDDRVTVEHELAAAPPFDDGRPPTCETATQVLHYEVFHSYLDQQDWTLESFFQAIRRLRTPRDAQMNGREIREFGFTPTTRSQFAMYWGVGRAFAVTVTFTAGDGSPASTAYVPAVTYGCDLTKPGDCQILMSTYSKVLCAASLFVGLFLVFFGHRYFQLEMFLVGFTMFAGVSYVLFVNHFETNAVGLAGGTSAMGLLGGLLWWFIWWYWGIPALSILPVILQLGFLSAAIFFYLPVSFEFLTHDFNFWSSFACFWLVLPVIFVTFTRLGNIVSCAILGSYAAIIPIDHYIGSSLKYIVLNVVRRATISNFGKAVLDPPYQDNDLILTVAWVALAVSGTLFQYLRERKRPPFSPPAEMWRRRNGHTPPTLATPTEQTPLLADDARSP